MNHDSAASISGLLAGSILLACSDLPGDAEVGQSRSPTIYGSNDVHEPFEYSDAAWAARAAEFSVALFDASALDESNPNDIRFRASWTVTSRLQATTGSPLCAGEEFATQPALSACSGVLIAEDLVLTAGHCTNGCGDVRFVFDYALTSAGTLPTLTADDVYACDATVVEHDDHTGTDLDYAILHLNRPVVGRTPAPIRAPTVPLAVGDALVMSGYPWRMPLKIADNAAVRSVHPSGQHVVTNLDAFQGNSGSGVFDTNRELAGLLVRGDSDFVFDGSCHRWHRCDDGACRGEDVMDVRFAVQDACTQIEADFCP